MQETTFNSPYYASVNSWLGALYRQASQKKNPINLDFLNFATIDSVKKLQSFTQYSFKNKNLLMNALIQSTFCYEFKETNNILLESNERLEFLGDSLVNFLVAKIIFKRYPNANEGELSKLRGSLVNEHSLAKLASTISLGENLFLGKGEYKSSGQLKESLLSNAFEALMAAIYIDSEEKIEVLEKTLIEIIKKYESETKKDFFGIDNLEDYDSKSKLQELSMALFQTLPNYKSIEEKDGFYVELWIGDNKLAFGRGTSKKKIEKELARIVLDEKRYLL